VFKYRAALSKGEEIRFISHLDYASLLQRAIARAKLPVSYSEGFNPHMKISFATAVPVGVTVAEEYMELELDAELASQEVRRRLAAQLPPGVELLRLKQNEGKLPALMSVADEAVYEIILPWQGDVFAPAAAVDAFKRAGQCVYQRITPKKRREIDVKAYVKALEVTRADDQELRLRLTIRITPTGSIKPGEVLEVLQNQFSMDINPLQAMIRRTALSGNGQPLV